MGTSHKMLKPIGGTPPTWVKYGPGEGAYYYVNGGSINTYKKASVLITLPNKVQLWYSGDWGRNGYISLGANGGSAGSIDIGIRNCARYEKKTEVSGKEGFGWEAYCYQCKTDSYPDKLHPLTSNYSKAPVGTKRAKVEVTPNLTSKNLITLKVQWLDGNNRGLGTFEQTFTLSRSYNWDYFYRFASLPTNDPNPSMNDSTYMWEGTFETAHLGSTSNTNWGINSPVVTSAWIINDPKCTVPYQWDVGEQFTIDHWA